jgi:multidrug efflux pump subunit AcrA (membrane-fusion protein)
VVATGERVAVLPLTSVYQRDGKPAVWRFDPATNQVKLTPIEIGQYREDGIVVTSGVADGDWIVRAGVHKLIEGQVVRPYEAGPASALNAQPARKQRG